MASFFQPPSTGDPAIEACDTSVFQVYCNALLPKNQRWNHWYQTLVVAIAVAAFIIPLSVWGFKLTIRLWKSLSRSRQRYVNSSLLWIDLTEQHTAHFGLLWKETIVPYSSPRRSKISNSSSHSAMSGHRMARCLLSMMKGVT